MENILITGANGFIGSNLAKRLINQGNCVRGLVRRTSNLEFLNGTNIELSFGDITQIQEIEYAFDGIDKVYHVAGLAADWGPYKKFEEINFLGTKNVAMVSEKNNVKKLIYISTVAFHGFGKTYANEESPISNKQIPYTKTKYLAEQWLWDFTKTAKLKVTAIRPGNVYGVNDRTFMLKYLDAMINGKFAEINNGKSLTCPIFIDNLIDIVIETGNSEIADNNAFIATDGLEIDWHTFNTKIAEEIGIKLPATSIPYLPAYVIAYIYYHLHSLLRLRSEPFLTPYRINNGGKNYHFSIEKLKKYFDYQPSVPLDEAIKKTVEWYRSYR
ncbi:MAG: NAD-dependent epimerase/dehydratase family protein [Deltaproteobacteria bacterium]